MQITNIGRGLFSALALALLVPTSQASAAKSNVLTESFGDDVTDSCDSTWSHSCEDGWDSTGDESSLSMCQSGDGSTLDWGVGIYGAEGGFNGIGQQVISPRDAASGLPTSVGVSVRAFGVEGAGELTTKLVYRDDEGDRLGTEEFPIDFTSGDVLTSFQLVTPPERTATVDVRLFSTGENSFVVVSGVKVDEFDMEAMTRAECNAAAQRAEDALDDTCEDEEGATFECTGSLGGLLGDRCFIDCRGLCLDDLGGSEFSDLTCDD